MKRTKEERTKKYMANQRHKKRLERMAKHECHRYPEGVTWVDERYDGGEWVPIEKPYAIKTSKSSHATRYGYFKRYSNRVIRRNKKVCPRGSAYKKEFDYRWTVD